MTEEEEKITSEDIQASPRVDFAVQALSGGQRLLDIGCNNGWFMDLVDCPEKWGLDSNEKFRPWVEELHYNFVNGYAWNLNFPENSFDRIHFGQTIAHMREEFGRQALEEIARVLAPRGIAVISTVVGGHFTSGMLYAIDQHKLVACFPSWFHFKEWEPLELVYAIKDAGLEIKQFTIVPQENKDSKTYKSNRFVQIYVVTKEKEK